MREKLTDYSLNAGNEAGGPTPRGFALILGITLEHLDHLEAELRAGILTTPVGSVCDNAPHGYNCVVDVPVRGVGDKRERTINIRTVSEISGREARPRLISGYPRSSNRGMMATIKQRIAEHDYVELMDRVGTWPAGTRGGVVSDYGEVKLVEISDPEDWGAALDFVQVLESRLRLITKHSA